MNDPTMYIVQAMPRGSKNPDFEIQGIFSKHEDAVACMQDLRDQSTGDTPRFIAVSSIVARASLSDVRRVLADERLGVVGNELIALRQRLEVLLATQDAITSSRALRDVLSERQRQIDVEGYTVEHDDQHINDELARMAAYYLMPHDCRGKAMKDDDDIGVFVDIGEAIIPHGWGPKRTDRRREVVIGLALGLAELQRLDREQS